MWDRLAKNPFLKRGGSKKVRNCDCNTSFDGDQLVVDVDDCSGGGLLAENPDCRATVIDALAHREANRVVIRRNGVERAYEGDDAALLASAGRFAERASFYDETLAERARRDPIRAGIDAIGRAGTVSKIAAETGLAEGVHRIDGYDDFRPFVGPAIARSRVVVQPPPRARLEDRYTLETGATVRWYGTAVETDDTLRTYHIEPLENSFDVSAFETLHRAVERLASGGVKGSGTRAPGRAVRAVATVDDPVDDLTAVLEKYTQGYGILSDVFADSAVSDVFATAPVDANPLRVRIDGELMRTNVRLTTVGAESLASGFRRTSGRAFSRASPTLDAVAEVRGTSVRVAGVTNPISDGVGFAFRVQSEERWTLTTLVENETISADAAGLLSFAVERAAAGLVAGARGAGKTTCLGALLWELPKETRTVVIEDTRELPVESLQRDGRDVQSLLTTANEDESGVRPVEALRTALRLGEGALVVGEVRGEEATVLYEAMRVGASGSAVLGTIHGDCGEAVYERVVTDLGVAPSSFATTQFVITLEPYETAETSGKRVKRIEEVVGDGDSIRFESLYELDDGELVSTGRIDRGNSALVADLAGSTETYADVRAAIAARTSDIEERVGRSNPSFEATTERMVREPRTKNEVRTDGESGTETESEMDGGLA
ncbi:ATPase, T2SS/T4P/T4SS family [Haladaptatus pallidirubidus]|uniref:Bacterial type II secretion system protein E domain-containing protein n=1 Tax=Haladaptatus pallidirubidus TaxID=1008152 RepID=A0AAV3UKL1_9EURY|nr:ATPase, T2SS/T4P/T4SS family [Haladaptatus pallidirubidus]